MIFEGEGDGDTSPRREDRTVGPESGALVERDAAVIPRQALSTPRLSAIRTVELAEKSTRRSPTGPGSRLPLAPGGSEAIEIALKIARLATGRHKTVSFWDAFRGAGLDAASVGGEAMFRSHGIGPLLPGTERVAPFARSRRPHGFPTKSARPILRLAARPALASLDTCWRRRATWRR